MDLCKSKQPFQPGIERPSVLSPPSSSPSKSPDQRRRRPKAPSESLAHDLLVQRTTLAVPGYAANSKNNNNRYRRAHRAEGEESTEDEEEEEEDYDSFQLTGYPELATKDRFKSASLEWTTGPNGVVTPRASHYNTHPPLDFKSLKEKLKRLIGSPHETYRKPFAGFSSSSSASFTSGHDERKTGVISGLHSVPYVTSPSADMMCSAETVDGHRATSSAEVLQNFSNTREERMKNAAKDSYLSERSNKVPWKDVANHVAETDKALHKILIRHYKELEDLKKKHEQQWIQLRSQISRSKDVQNLGRELMLNSAVRCNQTLSRSKSDVQLTALHFGAATKTPNRIISKSQFSEIGSRECVTSKHNDAVCPVTANFAESSYKDVHDARPGGNAAATPRENCPYVQRDANYALPFVNSHRTGSLYHTVSGLPQLTRPADAHCVSPMMQRQSELELAKQLENQMAALINQRMMHQQLMNLELAAKAQRPTSVGAGFYALPNGCFQYSCMPVFQQLQSPTMFASLPVYQEPICPPANTFPGAGTFPPWNPRTEFPQRIGSRTPCRELVQHHHHVPGNALPDPSSRQVLCSSLDQLPSEITRINASFAASPFAVKTQPPAPPQMPCFDNYLNRGYNNFPCFVNSFPSVPMSFLHPSMQYPPPDFKDIHQTLIPQPLDHQPYLTWS